MTKEELEKRIEELKASLRQVESNGNAIIGAIQECKYWIEKIKEINNKQ